MILDPDTCQKKFIEFDDLSKFSIDGDVGEWLKPSLC